ncbi:hypothetical protein [Planococcus shixiaomingii]|uniref:hypothetical protein n=1 Tax=Planococcus shixiaomingii TaxID=3058393 RepID=UPI0026164C87|nr:hypothetical protein [Planococcus sp. N022]WKA56556.1 hypothetical protein QWY21_09475 [Planococcus sp. N022]
MAQYYGMLVLSFVIFVMVLACLGYLYKQRKKHGASYKIDKGTVPFLFFFLLLSGYLLGISLWDLPNVLANKTEKYEGSCEVWVYDSTRNGHISVHFGDHKIRFPVNYQGVKEGEFYCKVSYFPQTEAGESLNLYKTKGGEMVSPQ